jgi:hypothetical protein
VDVQRARAAAAVDAQRAREAAEAVAKADAIQAKVDAQRKRALEKCERNVRVKLGRDVGAALRREWWTAPDFGVVHVDALFGADVCVNLSGGGVTTAHVRATRMALRDQYPTRPPAMFTFESRLALVRDQALWNVPSEEFTDQHATHMYNTAMVTACRSHSSRNRPDPSRFVRNAVATAVHRALFALYPSPPPKHILMQMTDLVTLAARNNNCEFSGTQIQHQAPRPTSRTDSM